jgi:ribosomal protein S18 acetylase RimI-like enzyme
MPIITEVKQVTPALVAAFARLLPQLSPGAAPLDVAMLREIVESAASTLLVAAFDEAPDIIIGSLTLVVFRIPSGLGARIASVVVDAEARGHGVGAALCTAAIARARGRGAAHVDLTSSPARQAANRLYLRLGFAQRTTNVYRLAL